MLEGLLLLIFGDPLYLGAPVVAAGGIYCCSGVLMLLEDLLLMREGLLMLASGGSIVAGRGLLFLRQIYCCWGGYVVPGGRVYCCWKGSIVEGAELDKLWLVG